MRERDATAAAAVTAGVAVGAELPADQRQEGVVLNVRKPLKFATVEPIDPTLEREVVALRKNFMNAKDFDELREQDKVRFRLSDPITAVDVVRIK